MITVPEREQVPDDRRPVRTGAPPEQAGMGALAGVLGNQAMGRMIQRIGTSDPAPGLSPAAPGNIVLAATPGSTVSDIPLDSPTFWNSLQDRAMMRLILWVSDMRDAVNEFVFTLKEADASSEWDSVVSAWLGVTGTYGDLVNAVWASVNYLSKDLDTPLTVHTFHTAIRTKINNLSTQVANVNSELPLYKVLRAKESQPDANTTTARAKTKQEIDQVLGAISDANTLRKKLVLSWITIGGKKGAGPRISHQVFYLVSDDEGSAVEIAMMPPEIPLPPAIGGVERPKETILALKNAYGDSFPLTGLNLPMTIEFVIYNKDHWLTYWEDQKVSWSYDPAGKRWAPTKGLGTDWGHTVFSDWMKRGVRPTIGALKTTDARRDPFDVD